MSTLTRFRGKEAPKYETHKISGGIYHGGHELTVVFEPPNSHEGSDSWLDALYNLLPAAAFEAPRQGQLGWNYFADPLLPHTGEGLLEAI